MSDIDPDDYLSGLPDGQRAELMRVNAPGLAALQRYLEDGSAVAFLGAGVSTPLYPLWNALIGELVGAADRLSGSEAATCRFLAYESPAEIAEIIREELGVAAYYETLREILAVKTDAESGRTWTPLQELVCRCSFRAIVTTNYDPGILDARMRVRTGASATGFSTWEDDLGLDGWRTGDVFGEIQLPVLYAHGQHNKLDSIVLAASEYRRAYEGKLPRVLGRLIDSQHLVWIGFSFADQRITAILDEIAKGSGTRMDPGPAPRHVAIMPWDPAAQNNAPRILARRANISFGAKLLMYPAPNNNHKALQALLSSLTDNRFRPAPVSAPTLKIAKPSELIADHITPNNPEMSIEWEPSIDLRDPFVGRAEELSTLDLWAADPEVQLIGVTAWGGAGKTALVTRWAQTLTEKSQRSGIRGIFGWSFYANPTASNWAERLQAWAQDSFNIRLSGVGRTARVLELLQTIPLVLVLDGLEVLQESPAGDGYGRFLDGALLDILSRACALRHQGLILLTSRFSFSDLEKYDGERARMLEVPPLTPAQGSALLAAKGADQVAEYKRRRLVKEVGGHALAVSVLAGLLSARPADYDIDALQQELAASTHTSARVAVTIRALSETLSEAERYLLAILSLFTRSVTVETLLTVSRHRSFYGHLDGWTLNMMRTALRGKLRNLVSWNQGGSVCTHPLVRDFFRPLALPAAGFAAEVTLNRIPLGPITSKADAIVVVDAIELLLDAGEWQAASNLYDQRTRVRRVGDVWRNLPAGQLGQRATSAFVETPTRREGCTTNLGAQRLGQFTALTGSLAIYTGDLVSAHDYLQMSVSNAREQSDYRNLSPGLLNLSDCLELLGDISASMIAAEESLRTAERINEIYQGSTANATIGKLASLEGDWLKAEEYFGSAALVVIANATDNELPLIMSRALWVDWLTQTERTKSSLTLAKRSLESAESLGRNFDAAQAQRQLGRIALGQGSVAHSGKLLAKAASCFRSGDCVTQLAITLIDQAKQAQAVSDFASAERHAAEAIGIAAPRKMVLIQSSALSARAHIFAYRADFSRGRDSADAALRLAARHGLAWHELDALRAHAALDEAEGTDNGWAAKADALRGRLIPAGLDPDPLATVERLVAEEKRSGA